LIIATKPLPYQMRLISFIISYAIKTSFQDLQLTCGMAGFKARSMILNYTAKMMQRSTRTPVKYYRLLYYELMTRLPR
jgi:type II secretory pathway component HofQ